MAVLPGSRVRSNNVYGIVADNPLTVGATTLTATGLTGLAAVSGGHAVITIDPLGTAGAPEIVLVTAHTAAAGTATISRGAYGTVARQHLQGVLWVHTPTIDDMTRVVTSATRPSDVYEGQLVYETDTDKLMVHNGSSWLNVIPKGYATGGGVSDGTGNPANTWNDSTSGVFTVTNPGVPVSVTAVWTGWHQNFSIIAITFARVAISLDGGASYTTGAEPRTVAGQGGSNYNSQSAAASHARSGTPTGDIKIKAQFKSDNINTGSGGTLTYTVMPT